MHFCHNENKLKIDKNSLPGNPSSIRAMGPKWATRGRCVPIPDSSTASPFLPGRRSWSFLEGAKSRRVLEKVRALSSLTRLDQPQSCTPLRPQSPHHWLWPWSFSGSLPLCWRHADSWMKGEVPPCLASFPQASRLPRGWRRGKQESPAPGYPKMRGLHNRNGSETSYPRRKRLKVTQAWGFSSSAAYSLPGPWTPYLYNLE